MQTLTTSFLLQPKHMPIPAGVQVTQNHGPKTVYLGGHLSATGQEITVQTTYQTLVNWLGTQLIWFSNAISFTRSDCQTWCSHTNRKSYF